MREAFTYRGARRNAAKGKMWRGVTAKPAKYAPIRLNRSAHLPPASSYAEARIISAEARA